MDASASEARATRGPSRADLGRRPLHRRRGVSGALLLSLVLHGTLLPAWWLAATTLDARAPETRSGGSPLRVTTPAIVEDGDRTPRPVDRTALEPLVHRPEEPLPHVLPVPERPVTRPLHTSGLPPDPAVSVWQVRAPRQPTGAPLPDEVLAPVLAAAPPAGPPAPMKPPLAAPASTEPAPPVIGAEGADAADDGAGAETEARPVADNPAPRYPGLARRRGWEGEVVLAVAVDAQGRPTEVTIDDSSGRRVLDEAAASAVFGWRFSPATQSGQAVAGRTTVRVAFVLED